MACGNVESKIFANDKRNDGGAVFDHVILASDFKFPLFCKVEFFKTVFFGNVFAVLYGVVCRVEFVKKVDDVNKIVLIIVFLYDNPKP